MFNRNFGNGFLRSKFGLSGEVTLFKVDLTMHTVKLNQLEHFPYIQGKQQDIATRLATCQVSLCFPYYLKSRRLKSTIFEKDRP